MAKKRLIKRSGERAFRTMAASVAMLTAVACETYNGNSAEIPPQTFIEEEADAVVEAALQKGKYPGIAVSISHNGKLVYAKGFGVTSLEEGDAVEADTVFPIGSLAKSFTALAIAQLAASEKVDLDSSIADYIDDLPDGWERIEVRNLINHTAGLFDYTNDKTIQASPDKSRDFEQMRAIWEDKPLSFEPGTQWNYSNSGYYLLGKIIEKASGLSYSDYVHRHIFEPFGMNDTYYPDGMLSRLDATGYEIKNGEQVLAQSWSPSVSYAAGALLSTVEDLAIYAHALHRSDKVSPEERQVIYTKDAVSGAVIPYALGGLNIQEIEDRLRYSHPGSIWGYTSYFSYYPDDDIAISILTNGDDSPVHPSNMERKLARIVLGEPQPDYIDAELSENVRKAIAGDYSIAPMNFVSSRIGFTDRDGAIFMVFGGVESEIFSFPLRYVGDGLFVAYHDDELTVQFDDLERRPSKAEITIYGGLLTAQR